MCDLHDRPVDIFLDLWEEFSDGWKPDVIVYMVEGSHDQESSNYNLSIEIVYVLQSQIPVHSRERTGINGQLSNCQKTLEIPEPWGESASFT